MKLETLEHLNDDELRGVIDRAEALLKERDNERKAKALADASATLAAVGLTLKDLASGKGRPKANGKAPAYHGGHTYQHPSDKTKVWNARGQKPGWVRALEAEGKRAVEVAAEAPRGTSSTAEKK